MSDTNKEELGCVWQMGTPCGGVTEELKLFGAQIKVPICKSHLEEHRDIMTLAKNGYDVESILQDTAEYRREQVLILKLSGIDLSNVEI